MPALVSPRPRKPSGQHGQGRDARAESLAAGVEAPRRSRGAREGPGSRIEPAPSRRQGWPERPAPKSAPGGTSEASGALGRRIAGDVRERQIEGGERLCDQADG